MNRSCFLWIIWIFLGSLLAHGQEGKTAYSLTDERISINAGSASLATAGSNRSNKRRPSRSLTTPADWR